MTEEVDKAKPGAPTASKPAPAKSSGPAKKADTTAAKSKKKVAEVKTEGVTRTATRKTKSVRRAEMAIETAVTAAVATATAVVEKEEIYAPDLDDEEYSAHDNEQMSAMYDQTISEIREGEVVKGRVQAITRDFVIVDVGFKSEGAVPIAEFPDLSVLKVGGEIDVFLDAVENQDGQLVLSKSKADFLLVWDRIRDAHDQNELVDGRVVKRIKGGLVIDLFGVEAFLPGSQVGLRQVPDFDTLLGQSLPLKIIKLNKARRNIVVSRRVVLEHERDEMRNRLLSGIAAGEIRRGKVKNITDFGVFIDLGGMDGLLHITDMSWGRIRHPSEIVQVGEEVDVMVLDFDAKSHRVSLGIKQLTPHPWENVETKYPVGSRLQGRVMSITDYGAFVELEKGVEGLVHISEMSWTQHVRHPSKLVQAGDTIEAMVLNVDREHQKISLGMKQLEPDPWGSVEQRFPVGTRHEGKVRNLTAFGAFVELEEGIDGLVHISDMSWTRRVQHPSEIMKKGDKVPVIVLNIDADNRKISLGHKQCFTDPWPHFHERFRVGNEMQGKIARMLERGVVVEIDNEVEGFVPLNQMGKKDLDKPEDAFKAGDVLHLRVIEFDPTNRRIVLSVDAYYRDKDRAELDQFLAAHPTGTTTLADAAGVPAPAPLGESGSPSAPPAVEPGPTAAPPAVVPESTFEPAPEASGSEDTPETDA